MARKQQANGTQIVVMHVSKASQLQYYLEVSENLKKYIGIPKYGISSTRVETKDLL
jgi:hypothetical protein